MEENKVKTYRITLDFDAIDNWRDSERDDLPVHGMVSFYKAAGVIDFFKEHKEEFGENFAPLDVMDCSYYTQQHIRKFIQDQWQIYSLSLLDHNKVEWNTRTYPKGTKHYHRHPSKRIVKSVNVDFLNYCPRLNEDLPDDVIEFVVPVEEEEASPVQA